MGNSRGNVYSRKHQTLDPDGDRQSRRKYFDFSFHEMGIYDLPAMIDYVLTTTNKEKLFFVGHSQGATQLFIMCSEKPEYNDKIIKSYCLSPAVFQRVPISPTYFLSHKFHRQLEQLTDFIGMYEYNPSEKIYGMLASALCRDKPISRTLCTIVEYFVSGMITDQLNTVRTATFSVISMRLIKCNSISADDDSGDFRPHSQRRLIQTTSSLQSTHGN